MDWLVQEKGRGIAIMFFFFNDTATTEIYTLSLHDALPISHPRASGFRSLVHGLVCGLCVHIGRQKFPSSVDRKSTRLNSSHLVISYAVFCLKKKTPRHSAALGQAMTSCRRRLPGSYPDLTR